MYPNYTTHFGFVERFFSIFLLFACYFFLTQQFIRPAPPYKSGSFRQASYPTTSSLSIPSQLFCSLLLYSSKRPLFGHKTMTFSKLCTKTLFSRQKVPILIPSFYCSWINYFACRLCTYPVVHCVPVKNTVNSSPVEYEQLEITVEPNPKEAPAAEPKDKTNTGTEYREDGCYTGYETGYSLGYDNGKK